MLNLHSSLYGLVLFIIHKYILVYATHYCFNREEEEGVEWIPPQHKKCLL
jgi:hypothetical protein